MARNEAGWGCCWADGRSVPPSPHRPPPPPIEVDVGEVDRLTGEFVGTAAVELELNQDRRWLLSFLPGAVPMLIGCEELVADRVGDSSSPPPASEDGAGEMLPPGGNGPEVFTSSWWPLLWPPAPEPLAVPLSKSSSISSEGKENIVMDHKHTLSRPPDRTHTRYTPGKREQRLKGE